MSFSINKQSLLLSLLLFGMPCHPSSAFQPTITSPLSLNPSLIHKSKSHQSQSTSQLYQAAGSNNFDENMPFENAVKNGWKPSNGSFIGLRRRNKDGRVNTVRKMFDTGGAVMPDGGLSPCIIKVVGVGGGGCNAVSCLHDFCYF